MSSTSLPPLRSDENRNAETRGDNPDCQPVSLLAFVEEENRELRRAVIDLALDTLRIKEALRGDKSSKARA